MDTKNKNNKKAETILDTKIKSEGIEMNLKEQKTLEEWRAIKLPVVYFPGKFGVLSGQPMIDFYKDKSWLFESAKMLNGWAQGEPLTEDEFDAGIERAAGHVPEKK